MRNRENTIFQTLCSVANQTFRDFELILVDNCSDDNSVFESQRFFNSSFFLDNCFNYRFIELPHLVEGVKDWNEPIKFAKGKYIAMLEGDDQFKSDHLERAYYILNQKKNIGVYSTGNQINKREKWGDISSEDHFKYIFSLKNVPPPSETIFIAKNKSGDKWYYNVEDHVYAPEIDLYLRIALEGFTTYYDNEQKVIRGISLKNTYKWIFFHDHFFILNKYRNKVSPLLYHKSYFFLCKKVLTRYFNGKYHNLIGDIHFKREIIGEIGYFLFSMFYMYVLLYSIIKTMYRKFVKPLSILFQRTYLTICLIKNREKEPYYSFNLICKYLIKGGFYPEVKKINLSKKIEIIETECGKIAKYSGKEIVYPLDWGNALIKKNLNNIINEQQANSPHRYLSLEEVSDDWVIYDLGAAEGYQSKIWSDKVKHIVIFEPSDKIFKCLEVTFSKEIELGKVTLINEGVSSKKENILTNTGELIKLDSIDNLISKYKLPYPNYVKSDIEGQELNFLIGATNLLNCVKLECLDICAYHRPYDESNIDEYLRKYPVSKRIVKGYMFFNRDGSTSGTHKVIFHPIIRRSVIRYYFNHTT